MKTNALIPALNRGLVSKYGLSRIDIERISMSAEVYSNAIPRVLGSTMLRPGLGYILQPYNGNTAKYIDFVYSFDDTALLEFTDLKFRPIVDEAVITRPAVTAVISNPNFSTGGSWTDSSDAGGSSAITGGALRLTGNGTAEGRAYQTVTVVESGTEHGLRLIIKRGTVSVAVGVGINGEEYLTKRTIGRGEYSLEFTPTGNFTITFASDEIFGAEVDSCNLDSAGDLVIDTIYSEANLKYIRNAQSIDVVYLACNGLARQKIERYGTRSWAVVDYLPLDGAFDKINITKTTVTPSAINGEITLTASKNIFTADSVDTLMKLDSTGKTITANFTAVNDVSDSVRITGVGIERYMDRDITGTWAGTIVLQERIGDDEAGAWVDSTAGAVSFTANMTDTYNDTLSNQIIHYRWKMTAYTSGSANVNLFNGYDTAEGIALISGYTSDTVVDALVVQSLGGTDATTNWTPTVADVNYAVDFMDNRLWWFGEDRMLGSIPDIYESFDSEVIGDSAVINRRLGGKSVARINWAEALDEIVLGGDINEYVVRSNDFGEVITPLKINVRSDTTQGSASGVTSVKADSGIFFVQSSKRDLYQLAKDGRKYIAGNMGYLIDGLIDSNIIHLAVQRKPDTRIHCLLADGTVYVLVLEESEEVQAWVKFETDGLIEDIVVLPGEEENKVYYLVNRDGTRNLEKFALESECKAGNQLAKCADSHISYTGSAITSLTGLSHLEGESVVIWADGEDRGTATVSSGAVALGGSYTNVCAGLTYKSQIKFSKLAYGAQNATAINQGKRVSHIGLVLIDAHRKGIKYGGEFTRLDDLPDYEDGEITSSYYPYYDEQMIPFDGETETDARVCLEMEAPRPCTISSLTIRLETNEK